ncbi:hypothetical protein M5D96_010963 [Drosophila gunungcola]|uniref:Uncharacterized protein n=1 Tax=Drosophila gunungcola TaxID=103775 RepID=A0A9P9YG52_9MUSC|nr:hypothetical protein M5D96_010963 [Drosophila gunungcola]
MRNGSWLGGKTNMTVLWLKKNGKIRYIASAVRVKIRYTNIF